MGPAVFVEEVQVVQKSNSKTKTHNITVVKKEVTMKGKVKIGIDHPIFFNNYRFEVLRQCC